MIVQQKLPCVMCDTRSTMPLYCVSLLCILAHVWPQKQFISHHFFSAKQKQMLDSILWCVRCPLNSFAKFYNYEFDIWALRCYNHTVSSPVFSLSSYTLVLRLGKEKSDSGQTWKSMFRLLSDWKTKGGVKFLSAIVSTTNSQPITPLNCEGIVNKKNGFFRTLG